MDELVKRLRELHPEEFGDAWDFAFACQQAMHEAADAIEELAASVEGFEAQTNMVLDRDGNNTVIRFEPRWIPVTERLPENDQDVLVMVHWRDYPENMMCYGRKYKTRWYLWNGELGELVKGFDITHWMPLPEPPKEE